MSLFDRLADGSGLSPLGVAVVVLAMSLLQGGDKSDGPAPPRKSPATPVSIGVRGYMGTSIPRQPYRWERMSPYEALLRSHHLDVDKPGMCVEKDGYGGIMVYQTYPGTDLPDFSKPAICVEKDGYDRMMVYQTYPGTNIPDSRKPGIYVERDDDGRMMLYETYPGTNIPNLRKPAIRIESDY